MKKWIKKEEKQMKIKNYLFFTIILISCVALSSTLLDSQVTIPIETISTIKKQNKLLDINAILDNITGECNARISNLYHYENTTFSQFNNTDNFTVTYPANGSYPTIDFGNLTLSKLSLLTIAMTDTFVEKPVANNSSRAKNGTEFYNAYQLAQNFSINETSQVSNFHLYVKYRNLGAVLPGIAGIVFANIYREEDFNGTDFEGDPVNTYELYGGLADGGGAWLEGWLPIEFNSLLVKGNYFLVTYVQSLSIILSPNNNSWQIQNYSIPFQDKGVSMFQNGTGHWNNISEDGNADFLLTLEIAPYIDPRKWNLTCYVDNQKLDLIHYEEPNPRFLKFPWTSYVDYYLPSIPNQDINVTFTTNQTLGWVVVGATYRYINSVEANGTFIANLKSRKWVINYTSVNSTAEVFPIFTFPSDWTINKFYNRFYQEIIEYGIMYSSIYNETLNGLYYPETGDGETTFNFSAIFTSHNYVSSINPQLRSGVNFKNQFNFKEGDTIRLQAIIQDSIENPASGGNCSFYIFNPSNNSIYFENTTAINGIANSNNISTSGWDIGDYVIVTTWTNGSEIGFSSFTFSLQEEKVPLIPPLFATPEPIWLYIITTALVVSMVMVGGLIVRRKLQERNWEKSLLHLFIMAKDGRSMYNYPFGLVTKDPTLISGMLTAMTSFVKETVGSKKQLRTIDQQDKKVILGHGAVSTVAVFAEKDISIIHNKTDEFLEAFERTYGFKIEHWDGSTEVFKGVNKLVEKYFPVSVESKIIQGVSRELLELKERIMSTNDPNEILSLLQEFASLAERYQDVIREHFNKEYGEILKIANKKIQNQ